MFAAFRRTSAALLPIVGAGAWLALVPPPVAAATPPCAASQLTLRVQDVDGPAFTGMSHGGAFAIVRNTGEAACSLSPLAGLAMRGADGTTVATGTVAGARFMHPGPVVLPLELQPGEAAAVRLRWVSGNVYESDRAIRATPAELVLTAGGGAVVAKMPATALWGDGAPVSFERERFTTALDPLGAPDPSAPGSYVGSGPAGSTLEYEGTTLKKLVLRAGPAGSLHFALDATRAVDFNNGSISGTVVPAGNRATFADAKDDCRLDFAFYGSQLTLAQTGSCGFGYGVDAGGRYHAVN